MKTCATCKHCIREKSGARVIMTCSEFADLLHRVLCEPPWDEACAKYEEVEM